MPALRQLVTPHLASRGIARALAGLGTLALVLGLAVFSYFHRPQTKPGTQISQAEIDAIYAVPLAPPQAPMRVFHLGHSLVGRDIPAMLQQFAGPDHSYGSQLGWGTPLRAHWEKDIEINGFAEENAHEHYHDANEALSSGDYTVFVATEMVEIRDAIAYHNSGQYMKRWAELARTGNPDIRIYLYETWPRIDDPDGWLTRLDRDLERYWEAELLYPALPPNQTQNAIHVIPVGQVFARFVRAVESAGGVDNLTGKEGLFRNAASGAIDPIHLNDLGTYLSALTHYAVLYQESPVGLPRQLRRADGSLAVAPSAETARLMQETVWQVVTSYPKTGVIQSGPR